MTGFLAWAALALMLSLLLGLIRVLRGPSAADRLMAAQLLGTTGVGLLLLLAPVLGIAALIDVALVLALLAVVAVAALTGREVPGGRTLTEVIAGALIAAGILFYLAGSIGLSAPAGHLLPTACPHQGGQPWAGAPGRRAGLAHRRPGGRPQAGPDLAAGPGGERRRGPSHRRAGAPRGGPWLAQNSE